MEASREPGVPRRLPQNARQHPPARLPYVCVRVWVCVCDSVCVCSWRRSSSFFDAPIIHGSTPLTARRLQLQGIAMSKKKKKASGGALRGKAEKEEQQEARRYFKLIPFLFLFLLGVSLGIMGTSIGR